MTAQIIKISVAESMPGLYYITLKLKIIEDTITVYASEFSVKHRNGTSISTTVDKFRKLMQDAIDKYKREQLIFNSQQFDSAIITLQGQLII